VKIDGKRAHELARAGEQVELARRPMTVRSVSVGEQGRRAEDESSWIEAELDVTKGTYVRSLAEELGRRLGLPAHLGSLRRLACADLRVDDARAVTGLGAQELPPLEGRPPRWRVDAPAAVGEGRAAAGELLRAKLEPPWARLPFPCFALNEAGAGEFARLLQGQRLGLDPATGARLGLEPGSGLCALVDHAGGRMVVARRDQDRAGRPRLAPSRVLRFPTQDPKKPA
jgi:tRNA pseudouridine55 synthase